MAFERYLAWRNDDNGYVPNMFGDAVFVEKRCTGASTRIMDEVISEFFNLEPGQSIEVVDHYPEKRASKFLCDRICDRLKYEYGVKFYRHGTTIVKVEN